jgi:hypothetical protein
MGVISGKVVIEDPTSAIRSHARAYLLFPEAVDP